MSRASNTTEPKLNANPVAPAATSCDATSTPSTGFTWMSSLRDLSSEHGFEPLRVEGAVPTELSGTLYRTRPSLFSSFGKPYGHLFEGDSAVSAVRFANGRALGAVKLVQIEGLVKVT
jgi:carotenoid cleavage dioxygenase-like enzyme